MRILHTADWHLGRVFHGLSLLEDQAVLLKQVRQIAREEKADVLVMAGDVYDRGLPPTDAVELLDETLSAFALDLQIPVLLIAGNHDNAKRLEYGKALSPGGISTFSDPSAPPRRIPSSCLICSAAMYTFVPCPFAIL